MYKMTTLNGSREFWFQRPNEDINNVLKEFTKDLHECLTRQTEQSTPTFLKSLFDLITLCEDPTKNYYKIEEVKLGDFGSLNYYFHFSKALTPETNELVSAIPELFESPEYYFTFLSGIKIQVTMLIHQARSKPKSKQKLPLKPQPRSIAYAIWFLQKAGSTTESNVRLFEIFCEKFGSTVESIKSYYYELNGETETFHLKNKAEMNEAIKLLGEYKSRPGQKSGRQFIKEVIE